MGAVAGRIAEEDGALALPSSQVGRAPAMHVTGAFALALCFGRLIDRFGPKRLIPIMLASGGAGREPAGASCGGSGLMDVGILIEGA